MPEPNIGDYAVFFDGTVRKIIYTDRCNTLPKTFRFCFSEPALHMGYSDNPWLYEKMQNSEKVWRFARNGRDINLSLDICAIIKRD